MELSVPEPGEVLAALVGVRATLGDEVRSVADRWVAAVNADGRYGHWLYDMIHKPEEAIHVLNSGNNSGDTT